MGRLLGAAVGAAGGDGVAHAQKRENSAPLLEHEKRRFGWATEPKGKPVADTGGGVELGALLLVVPPQIAVRVPGLEKSSATQAELDAVVVPGKGEIDA